ncbi:MAG: hypothetical protein AAFU55_03485 [Pseudomonadota bacterium]
MKAIIHIGMPKTGTTTLQKWLGANAAGLLAQGVLYDRIKLRDARQNPSQVELFLCCLEEMGREVKADALRRQFGIAERADQTRRVEEFQGAIQRMMDAQPDAERIVFSTEYLSGMCRTVPHVQAISAWADRLFDKTTFVVYLRRQEDYLVSRYVQTLREGAVHTVEEYLEKVALQDYWALTERWVEGSGDRLKVRLMEPGAMKDGDLIADFCEVIGADPGPLEPVERANESFSGRSAEIMRALNVDTPRFVDERARGKNPFLVRTENRLLRLDADGAKLRLMPEELADVRRVNAEGNERLRAKWFPEREALFPEKPAPAAPGRPTAADVAELAARLLKDVDEERAADAAPRIASSKPEPTKGGGLIKRLIGQSS